jgi:hypothetical protein
MEQIKHIFQLWQLGTTMRLMTGIWFRKGRLEIKAKARSLTQMVVTIVIIVVQVGVGIGKI